MQAKPEKFEREKVEAQQNLELKQAKNIKQERQKKVSAKKLVRTT